MTSKFFITTNGCAINKYKINAYKSILKNAGGIISSEQEADIVIMATCSFTQERENDTISHIKNRQAQGKKVAIAGCTLPSIINQLNNVDTIPNEIKPFNNFRNYLNHILHNTPECNYIPTAIEDGGTIVQISTGCTGACNYCSIKGAQPNHGKLQSLSHQEIINQISTIQNNTIYLVGSEVSSYGLDIMSSLPNLLEDIRNNFPDIKIHLGNLSIGPAIKWTDGQLDILAKTEGNLNFPIQSGSNKVIKEMGRFYTVNDFDKLYNELTKRGCCVITDYIIGYPTETEEDFEQTLNFISKYHMKFAQIFAYEPRYGTPAAALPQLPTEIIEERICKAIARYLKTGKDYYGENVIYNSNVSFID